MRSTVQRRLVLETVRRLRDHATADEVYDAIKKEHPSVSRATVYRNLNLLAQSGEIKRVEVPNGADRFDHRTQNHYHAECLRCGKLIDVDMEYMESLENRIADPKGFEYLGHDILFKGFCEDCRSDNGGLTRAQKLPTQTNTNF
ncbi:MAG: transcriptional repressor [Oscillospiraceae bacterium]|nr:transcriptional repressor [Oscillospiraceae bacterium]